VIEAERNLNKNKALDANYCRHRKRKKTSTE